MRLQHRKSFRYTWHRDITSRMDSLAGYIAQSYRVFFFAAPPTGRAYNEKKRARQTSISTHPVHATEADMKRDKIIAILYTALLCFHRKYRHPCGQCENKRPHSRAPRIGSSSGLESEARERNSEEDVYYRNDSMLWKLSVQ